MPFTALQHLEDSSPVDERQPIHLGACQAAVGIKGMNKKLTHCSPTFLFCTQEPAGTTSSSEYEQKHCQTPSAMRIAVIISVTMPSSASSTSFIRSIPVFSALTFCSLQQVAQHNMVEPNQSESISLKFHPCPSLAVLPGL